MDNNNCVILKQDCNYNIAVSLEKRYNVICIIPSYYINTEEMAYTICNVLNKSSIELKVKL